jgi:hypothetical protein
MKTRLPKSKKGAIEMSMQTIIVVVIGVTLLTLGLRFVYTTFGNLTDQGQTATDLSQKQLSELYGESDNPIFLPRDSISVKKGDTEVIDLIIKNTENENIKAGVKVVGVSSTSEDNVANTEKWFLFSKLKSELKPGNGKTFKLTINPGTAGIETYLVTFEVTCDGSGTICGETAELILEITS